MRKMFLNAIATTLVFAFLATGLQAAQISSDPVEVSATDLGATEDSINNATEEEVVSTTETGMLIEIGNTTAEETTVIVRVTDADGNTEDKTLEIDTTSVDIDTGDDTSSDLNDWIAGDQLTFDAAENTNSGSIDAVKVVNRSIRRHHRGRNGWIVEIREDQNKIDVTWNNKVYTLNIADARMVAGLKNPAGITDLMVGDRIRARVLADGDGNELTWDAEIVVVLRRGKDLFMRVTRWVVRGEIVYLEGSGTLPTVMTVEVLPSRFYQEGDVNNLVGEPGDTIDVNITDVTKLRRRYFGKTLLSEFTEGDEVQVIGRLNEGTGQLDAKFVRNASIQRLGVSKHVGIVTAVDTSTGDITVKAEKNLDNIWTISTNSETKFHHKGDDTATIADVMVDDRIRVRGTANRKTKTVVASALVVLKDRAAIKAELRANKQEKLNDFKAKRQEIFKELRDNRQERRDSRKAKRATNTPAGSTTNTDPSTTGGGV